MAFQPHSQDRAFQRDLFCYLLFLIPRLSQGISSVSMASYRAARSARRNSIPWYRLLRRSDATLRRSVCKPQIARFLPQQTMPQID
jgi:hypothetical protein